MTAKKPKGQRWTMALLLLSGLLVITGCTFFFPYWIPTAIVYAPNFGRQAGSFEEANPEQLKAWGIKQQIPISVGPPPAQISAWVMEPPQPARGTVLVLHGIRDSKTSMRGMGQLLANGGYRSVLIDLRGHGLSSGLTYGVVDSQDLVQVLDAIDRQNLLTPSIGVFGCSYGAAAAIQLAARDPRFGRWLPSHP